MRKYALLIFAAIILCIISAGCISEQTDIQNTEQLTLPSTFVQNEKISYPIVDSHLHYYSFTENSDGFENLIRRMDSSGVEKAVLFGTGVVKLWSEYDEEQPMYYMDSDSDAYYFTATDYMMLEELEDQPDSVKNRILPFICGINPTDKASASYLEKVLELYPNTVAGIGEILLKHDDLTSFTLGEQPRADSEAMYLVYELAAKYNLPVLIHENIAHSNSKDYDNLHEMENALKDNRDTTFIWAHVGISRRVTVDNLDITADRLLSENKNLYFDLSWIVFEDYINVNQDSLNKWAKLIEKYPDRFMIGTDLVGEFAGYRNTITRYHTLISLLSEDTAKKVCAENILSLVKTY